MEQQLDIILADDHEIFREGLKSLIGKDSAIQIVAEARDGEELIDAVRAKPCDVIVTDLSMPNMDGLSAIRNILKFFFPNLLSDGIFAIFSNSVPGRGFSC